MEYQNKVILSLGSNLGNRSQNIEHAIGYLQQQVGSVIRVSGLFETQAWGFDSGSFLNCAILLHTSKTVFELLALILQIEKKLKRAPKTTTAYEDRIIDIDIIGFNDEIIDQQNLQVPHPQMHQRLFVLLPMQNLDIDYVHPRTNQNLRFLITNCKDKNGCVFFEKIHSPMDSYMLQKLNYIAIEGNIGAGKTTLAIKIAEDFNAKTVLERFAENPFLPKFYQDQCRFAFPLEMSFLADRYQQLSDDLAQFDLFKDFIVADYHIFKSLIFSKVTLANDEFRLYKTLFDIIYKEMPKPDLYIYLYQNTARLLQNIKLRGRDYEQDIEASYLEKINQGYLEYIKSQQGLNVLIIDVSERDFVKNQEDYVFLLSQISQKIESFF